MAQSESIPLLGPGLSLLSWKTFVARMESMVSSHSGPLEAFPMALKQHFGPEYDQLRAFTARILRLRATLPVLGNVVFVHGTMCGNLTTRFGSTEDLLWLNLPRLSQGELALLRLAEDGSDLDPTCPLNVSGINKMAYAGVLLWLQGRWNVQPFAYDWRKDLDGAADALALHIEKHFAGQPVHLVAHSMGGMVCRNFIRRHGYLWREMRDPTLQRGGRLVMLGTPHSGTYLSTQAMSGQSELVSMMAGVDLKHSSDEILTILDTFVANYQLLPAPSSLTEDSMDLYSRETWGDLPVSERHLMRARAFHQELTTPENCDPERLINVMGYGIPTPCALPHNAPGTFEHRFTLRGDGVTTLELGTLPGVPTGYLMANHLELAVNPRILAALDDLLLRGSSRLLWPRPLMLGSSRIPALHKLQEWGDQVVAKELRTLAQQSTQPSNDPAESRRAERFMIQTLMGERRLSRRLWELELPRARAFLDPS